MQSRPGIHNFSGKWGQFFRAQWPHVKASNRKHIIEMCLIVCFLLVVHVHVYALHLMPSLNNG